MSVASGSTDVIQYFTLRDSTTHNPKTDVTITDIDIYYLKEGEAISSKADLTAHSAATDAHADNYGYNNGRGLYRIDFPDAAFNGGVGKKVQLIVECTGVDTAFLEIILSAPVDITSINGSATAAANLAIAAAHMVTGTVDNAAFTPTTTQFESDDITEATADHYKNAVVMFTSGALQYQRTVVTAYELSGGKGHFTVTALTEAPANNDTFILL